MQRGPHRYSITTSTGNLVQSNADGASKYRLGVVGGGKANGEHIAKREATRESDGRGH